MNKKAIEFQQEIKDFINKIKVSQKGKDRQVTYFYDEMDALMASYIKNYKKEFYPALQLSVCEEFFVFYKVHTLVMVDILMSGSSEYYIKKLDMGTLRGELFWDLVSTIEAYQIKHGRSDA